MRTVVAGKRNQKVTIYKPVAGKTESGAPIKNKFQLAGSPWVSIIPKSISDSEIGNSQQSKIAYSIATGWRDISPNWLILWRNQLLRVVSVDDSDSMRRQKILIAETENGVDEASFLENSVVDAAVSDLETVVNEAWQ
jgi:head-tail adaptor